MQLVLAPGEGPVLEKVTNPMGYTPEQGRSLGIRVLMDGKEQYALMTVYPDDSSAMMVWKPVTSTDGWPRQCGASRPSTS